jgi:hypothetical protein
MNESIDLEQNGGTWRTKSELAAHFGCDKRTIGNWMRRKIIPFVRIRGVLRFYLQDCESALCQYRQKPFWESGKAGRDTAPIPQQASPPPPDAPAQSGPSRNANLILLQVLFTNRHQIERALAVLGECSSASNSASCPAAEAGKWILLLLPEDHEGRNHTGIPEKGGDTAREISSDHHPKQ